MTGLKTPIGRRQPVGYLQAWPNPVSARSGTRTQTAGLGVRRADHSATLPHLGMVNVSVQ